MINIIQLGYTPHCCCWVHRRGQAQGLLAVYVPANCDLSAFINWTSSEEGTGVIRLYDGRGDDKPLETIENLHRFPVHLMTVCLHPLHPVSY
jgi:peptidylprolyl isomerase domain and WD repeat-containing protein 1